ncbi:MAG TPA: hypothetical protein DDY32_01860, partial [Desulfobulbaceae bacterium]|nr:hypothetical protein [Desulfobulbaceae bacterium]
CVLRRPGDLVARYGGEEFVMLLPETDAFAAYEVAQRCLQKVVGLAIRHQYSRAGETVTISIGLVTKGIDAITAPQIFIATADKNLYLAKENGRNRIVESVIG